MTLLQLYYYRIIYIYTQNQKKRGLKLQLYICGGIRQVGAAVLARLRVSTSRIKNSLLDHRKQQHTAAYQRERKQEALGEKYTERRHNSAQRYDLLQFPTAPWRVSKGAATIHT